MYLGKRDFIDHCDGNVDPVEGVVSVEKDYLKGRKIFGQVRFILFTFKVPDGVMYGTKEKI